jgi:electron transfer flavoprotein beta subunit
MVKDLRLMVSIKRVVDYAVKVRVARDGNSVDTQGLKKSINPFDSIALEEALRLKDQGLVSEIIVISVGDVNSEENLRQALALGADRAILVTTTQEVQSLDVAKIFASIAVKEQVDLFLLGKQAIDTDNQQVPQMLAGLLNWPQAINVVSLQVQDDKLILNLEHDNLLKIMELSLPAVISADLRLNKPRYVNIAQMLRAKSKPLQIIPATSIIKYKQDGIKSLSFRPFIREQQNITWLQNSQDLVLKLKEHGAV